MKNSMILVLFGPERRADWPPAIEKASVIVILSFDLVLCHALNCGFAVLLVSVIPGPRTARLTGGGTKASAKRGPSGSNPQNDV